MISKAQGAIEYLLIMGAAVIIAVIVIMLMMSLSDTGTTNIQEAGLESIYSDLMKQRDKSIGDGLTINGVFYSADDPFIENVVGLFSFDNGLNNAVYPNDPGVCSNEPGFEYSCPGVVEGKFGNALYFDYEKRQALLTDIFIDQRSGCSEATFAAWVKTIADPPTEYLTPSGRSQVISTDNSDYDWGILTEKSLTQPNKWKFFDGSNSIDSGVTVNIGEWQHVAAVFNCDEKKVHFYVNGQWIKTSSPGNNMFDNSTYYVAIGGNPSKNFDEFKEFFYGIIDEVVIIDRPFSGEEIQKLYGGI